MNKSVFKESKAQTGIEYLLILAGAVLVVVVVGYVLKGIAQSTNTQVSAQAQKTG